MMLTTQGIESFGFVPLQPGGTLEAVFHSLHVYKVRGFTLQDEGVVSRTASSAGVGYTLAIGGSVNEICATILGDAYTDDEEAWAKTHNCTPPYAIIHFGPTQPHVATQGYTKTDHGKIITYDTFGAARSELNRLEARTLPSIEMAMSCAFSQVPPPVRFEPIEQVAFGITPAKETVHDIRITGSARGYVSAPLAPAEVDSALVGALALAESVDPRVSRFYQLGLRDEDNLKRFLYFFLAVEIEVHRAFRTVSRAQHIANGAALDPRIGSSLAHLIEHRDNWTNLADRFVWCAISLWRHLSDSDIEEFKRLKKIRDSIAHGELTSPDAASVVAVENFAKKLHT